MIAGSPFATAELKCVALTALLAIRLSHRQVGLTLYVDDLSLAACGPCPGVTARRLHAALCEVQRLFAEAGLFFAEDKTTLFASSLRGAEAAKTVLGPM